MVFGSMKHEVKKKTVEEIAPDGKKKSIRFYRESGRSSQTCFGGSPAFLFFTKRPLASP